MAPPLSFMGKFEIRKIDEYAQQVFGWASVAFTEDGEQVVDSHDHIIEGDELEKAVYQFNLVHRALDEKHTEAVQGHLIESLVVTPEKLEKMGLPKDALPQGWWVGFWVPDPAVFAKVVEGDYEMFSIAGTAVIEDV